MTKFRVTTSDGVQTIMETDESHAVFSARYNASTDILPVQDTAPVEEAVSKSVKKRKAVADD